MQHDNHNYGKQGMKLVWPKYASGKVCIWQSIQSTIYSNTFPGLYNIGILLAVLNRRINLYTELTSYLASLRQFNFSVILHWTIIRNKKRLHHSFTKVFDLIYCKTDVSCAAGFSTILSKRLFHAWLSISVAMLWKSS